MNILIQKKTKQSIENISDKSGMDNKNSIKVNKN